jgi:uncharacterized protein (TIGR02677 family)
MEKWPNLKSLSNISELKYINADNVARYRAIMRYLFLQYQKLNYWLKPEQIYEGITSWNLFQNYTLDQCQIDLEQLVSWKNLTSRHDGGRAVTIEEYLRKKFQYLITPYSIEIERFLDSLDGINGYGGSLEPTRLDKIADILYDIKEKNGIYNARENLELWNTLYEAFQKLHETSVDYIASLQAYMTEELLVATSFILYKDSITGYLQDFVQALQRKSYRIEGCIKSITVNVRDNFINNVVDDEWLIPKLDYSLSKEEYRQELLQKWDGLCKWFCGEADSLSELTLLERASKEAIIKIVKGTLRIQERKRSTISRRKELDFLGQWFYGIKNLDEAHKLSAYVFGLFPTRHLQGTDNRNSDSQDMSMWKEVPICRTIRARNRKRNEKHDTEEIVDYGTYKEKIRKTLILKRNRELEFLAKMIEKKDIYISEMGVVTSIERQQILTWISRCNASSSCTIQTPEGIEIRIFYLKNTENTTLYCEDGDLELRDYKISFKVINTSEWDDILGSPNNEE